MKLKTKLFLFLFSVPAILIAVFYILIPFDLIFFYVQNNMIISSVIAGSLLILLILIYIILLRTICRPIKQIINAISIIDKEETEILKNIDFKRNDEIGSLSKSIKALHTKLRFSFNFINTLIRGRYNPDYVLEDKGMLSMALIELRDKLVITEKEKKYIEEENRKTEWYQHGVSEFTSLLQQNFEKTEDMTYAAIKKLVKHLEVDQGGIFILETREDKELLILEAAYAYDKKKLLNTEIEIGESLVGKCAKEKEIIHIDDLPEGYTYIGSGLGENTPKSLILVPLIYENNLFGIIEIASLTKISEYKITFIQVIGERIASEISNIQSRILSVKLANDYRKQADDIIVKEKETAKTISELIKHQEESSEIIDVFNTVSSILIFDKEGILTDANPAGRNLYKIDEEDINKKSIFDLKEKLDDFWTDVIEGKTQKIVNIYKKDDKEFKIYETISPIFNEEGTIDKVINIGIDISNDDN